MKHLILFMAALAQAGHSRPVEVTDVKAIDRAIEEALGSPAGSPGGAAYRIDPRMKLAACPASLTVLHRAHDAVDVLCPARGWKVRVPILGGGASAAAKPMVIKRGDTVQITARGAGFEVVTAGVALEPAAAGQELRVKSLTDGATFLATASKPGSAVLND